LNLSSNSLFSLPHSFFTLTKLVELDLSHNYIEYIPHSFGTISVSLFEPPNDHLYSTLSDKLHKLVSLNLSFNRLRILPPCVFQLSLLGSLVASNNLIEEIKGDFG